MKSNLLLDKIHLIQTEYKELLISLLPKLKTSHSPEALDEINLFWLRNIDTIQLYLNNWFPGENSYVFTAVTYMDFEDNEHLPFLLMGEKHVLDDPLSKYSEINKKMPECKDADFLYKQIGVTAEDNLKILESVHNEILILPLRLFNQLIESDFPYEAGEGAFISLFNDINSLDDYFIKCKSFSDIMRYARDDIDNLVMFSEKDDTALSFEERFRIALTDTQFMIDESKPDSYNFFMLVYGSIQQAIDIIASCVEYDCIPYIRYPVAFHYVSLLSKSILDVEHMNTLCFKMSVAFVVYKLCNKNRMAAVCLEDFLKKNREYNFNAKLFQTLADRGISEQNYLEHTIADLVLDELKKFYDVL